MVSEAHNDQEKDLLTEDNRKLLFNHLIYNDSLSDIERIAHYSTSFLALQRYVHIKLMSEVAKKEGFAKTRDMILPLLDVISLDSEPILRTCLASQLAGLAEVCANAAEEDKNRPSSQSPDGGDDGSADGGSEDGYSIAEEGYQAICEVILPVLNRLLSDKDPTVRATASESLVQVASYIRRQDLGPRVLTLALALTHDDENAHLRLSAAALLNSLADVMGPDITIQFLMPELIALSEDPHYDVRKMAVLSIEAIGRVSGPTVAATRLLPMFIRWSCDDVWIIRKACASSIIHLSKALDPAIRVQSLVPIFERLASDTSKFVRAAAYDNFGLFVATLPGDKIPPSFLNHYKRMGIVTIDNNLKELPKLNAQSELRDVACLDSDLAAKAAYSFPAVLLALGRNRWNEVRTVFYSLVKDPQVSVRQPIAAALAEIAKIIGPEATVEDVLPVLDIFLHDVDEVKQKVLKILSSVIALLPPDKREGYAPFVRSFYADKNASAWRARQSLVPQLYAFSTLFSLYSFASYIAPIIFDLLEDPSEDIRLGTAETLPDIMNMLLFSVDPPSAPDTNTPNTASRTTTHTTTTSISGDTATTEPPKTPERPSLLRNPLSGQKKTAPGSGSTSKSLSAYLSGVSQSTPATGSPLNQPPTQLGGTTRSEILESSTEFAPNAYFTTFYNQLVQLLVHSDTFRNRKTFVIVAEAILQSPHSHLFVPYILPHLVHLLKDPVRDIRIAVAGVLAPYASLFAVLEHILQREWLHYLKANPVALEYAPSVMAIWDKHASREEEEEQKGDETRGSVPPNKWSPTTSSQSLQSFFNPFVRTVPSEDSGHMQTDGRTDGQRSGGEMGCTWSRITSSNVSSVLTRDSPVTKDTTADGTTGSDNGDSGGDGDNAGKSDESAEDQRTTTVEVEKEAEGTDDICNTTTDCPVNTSDKYMLLLPTDYPPTITPVDLMQKLSFVLQRKSVKELLFTLPRPDPFDTDIIPDTENIDAEASEMNGPESTRFDEFDHFVPAWLHQYLIRASDALPSKVNHTETLHKESTTPTPDTDTDTPSSVTSPHPVVLVAYDDPHPLGQLYTALRALALEDDLQIIKNLQQHSQMWIDRHRYLPVPCPKAYLRKRNLVATPDTLPISYDYNALHEDGIIRSAPETSTTKEEEPSILLEIAEEEKVPINAPLPSLGGQTYASVLGSLRSAGGVCPASGATDTTPEERGREQEEGESERESVDKDTVEAAGVENTSVSGAAAHPQQVVVPGGVFPHVRNRKDDVQSDDVDTEVSGAEGGSESIDNGDADADGDGGSDNSSGNDDGGDGAQEEGKVDTASPPATTTTTTISSDSVTKDTDDIRFDDDEDLTSVAMSEAMHDALSLDDTLEGY